MHIMSSLTAYLQQRVHFTSIVKLKFDKESDYRESKINEHLMKTAMQRQWPVTCATSYLGNLSKVNRKH